MKGTTTKDDGHKHDFEIDGRGNGKTTSTIGEYEPHVHSIKIYKVENTGHTHELNSFDRIKEKVK